MKLLSDTLKDGIVIITVQENDDTIKFTGKILVTIDDEPNTDNNFIDTMNSSSSLGDFLVNVKNEDCEVVFEVFENCYTDTVDLFHKIDYDDDYDGDVYTEITDCSIYVNNNEIGDEDTYREQLYEFLQNTYTDMVS